MWELLQKLEDLGWKPYGKSIAELTETEKNVRLLTSLSSGLWQFVCENGMVDVKDNRYDFFEYYKGMDEEGAFREAQRYDESYEYRLIEASLKDESELEDFLLSNIVIKDEK